MRSQFKLNLNIQEAIIMETKYYLIEILDQKLSASAFFEEYKAASYFDALAQAKSAYPNSEMFNVYISASCVRKSEGGNK
jgi:hypothetical protein